MLRSSARSGAATGSSARTAEDRPGREAGTVAAVPGAAWTAGEAPAREWKHLMDQRRPLPRQIRALRIAVRGEGCEGHYSGGSEDRPRTGTVAVIDASRGEGGGARMGPATRRQWCCTARTMLCLRSSMLPERLRCSLCGTVMTGDRRPTDADNPAVVRAQIDGLERRLDDMANGLVTPRQVKDEMLNVSDVPAHRWRRQWRGQRGAGAADPRRHPATQSSPRSTGGARRLNGIALSLRPTATAGPAAAPKWPMLIRGRRPGPRTRRIAPCRS
jgi:hypothetical protein